jgi:hypothetical protein
MRANPLRTRQSRRTSPSGSGLAQIASDLSARSDPLAFAGVQGFVIAPLVRLKSGLARRTKVK